MKPLSLAPCQNRRGRLRLFVLGLLACLCGCSGDKGSAAPSPKEAARQALAEYDADKDGALDAKELDACPGIKSGLKRVDKNSDGRVSADELADRLTFLQQVGSLSGVGLQLTFNGAALPGATVTLVPEKFQGPTFKPLSVISDDLGSGTFAAEGLGDSVPAGYYRLEVSKKNQKGQELIPAKYNAKTVLGQEIGPDVEGGGRGTLLTVRLTLTSK